jgi:hypothetical protein
MAEENRAPDRKIGEIARAEEQPGRTSGHKPPHGPGALKEEDEPEGGPNRNPAKKNAGES